LRRCGRRSTIAQALRTLRAALKNANFTSVRGAFKFNNNHYPIQDFYLAKVGKRLDGRYETEIVKKVFTNYSYSYAKDCMMK
jgi:branched-chain amino acid transport system substrate-binding protein